MQDKEKLLTTLEKRFELNMHRHPNISWAQVLKSLQKNKQKLLSLEAMEKTGGEPDVIGYDTKTKEYLFVDCAPESPKGRRSACYDQAALLARKQNKPKYSAVGMAEEMGAEILDEDQYRSLQKSGPIDTKTSSWIKTPPEVRNLGGALFCDRRYDRVFVYHNGAESYYAVRGFRCILRV